MKKRALSLLMSVVLLFSLLPATIRAAETDCTVLLTVYEQGRPALDKSDEAMLLRSITVEDLDGDGKYTIDEALRAAHAACCPAGAAGYTTTADGWVTTLWGDASGAFGYCVNDASAWSVADELTSGDRLSAYIYYDVAGYSDRYAYFDEPRLTVAVGTEQTLTLAWNGYDESWSTVTGAAVSGAPLGVFDAKTGAYSESDALRGEHLFGEIYMKPSTGLDGKVSFSFTKTGTYYLTAQFDSSGYTTYNADMSTRYNYLVPPLCVVTVLSAEDFAAYEAQGVVESAKKLLTWSSLSEEAQSAVTAAPTLPAALTVDGKSVSVSWASSCPALTVSESEGAWSAQVTRGAADASGELTATLTYAPEGAAAATGTVRFSVTVKAAEGGAAITAKERVETLLKAIAAANTETSGEWWIMDMGAYRALGLDDTRTSDEARQAYINAAVKALSAAKVSDTTYDKAILAMTAIGADARQLYPVNANTPIDAVAGLSGVTQSASAWSAPYTLAAYNQGEYENTASYERALLDALLAAQQDDGSWNEWGTIDTTANAIAGLAFYAGEEAVDAAIANGVAYLASQMSADGTFDGGYGTNANSTAMVIVGLAAAGIDPDTDERFVKNGVSLLDGLLSFALENGSGFGYTSSASYNASATEQAFRALIAARQVMESGKAYNVYDFSANAVAPVRATAGSGSVSQPAAPEGDTLRVSVTIKADNGYWLRSRSVTLASGSATVYDALLVALEGSGITQTGAASGYVRSMTKDGRTLGEFDAGENSGWLYKVNGALPNVGLRDYDLADGDSVVWYFTEDWTRDPSAGSISHRRDEPKQEEKSEEAPLCFTDVDADAWYAPAVRWAMAQGLMTGVSEERFAPEDAATRAQFVTLLWRLRGKPVVNYLMLYGDVAEDAWYGEAVRWASSTRLADGYSADTFAPDAPLTREQLAVLLYRYVCAQGGGFRGMWYFPLRFDDAAAVSRWADEAMHWCVMRGILTGLDERTLAPQSGVTRAQLAVILERFCALEEEEEQAETGSDAAAAFADAASYLVSAVPTPCAGDEWVLLALARGGVEVDADAYLASLEVLLREADGVLSTRKYTEYSRAILALSALGIDARDVAGYDLTLPLGDFEKTTAQGVNGAIFALLALDSADYPMPAGGATRQRYVDALLAAQGDDGGWSLREGDAADADLTAMALQALAKYRAQTAVAESVTRALGCLSAMQAADGGFSSGGAANAESCAQVLLALCELGIDAEDARFVKDGGLTDALLAYQTAEGGFRHTAEGAVNRIASEQAACALAALARAQDGSTSFYRMSAEKKAA